MTKTMGYINHNYKDFLLKQSNTKLSSLAAVPTPIPPSSDVELGILRTCAPPDHPISSTWAELDWKEEGTKIGCTGNIQL